MYNLRMYTHILHGICCHEKYSRIAESHFSSTASTADYYYEYNAGEEK